MENIFHHLEQRGFIAAVTSHELYELANRPIKVYVGFDPTATSLHLGNLVGIIALGWFARFGHTAIALIGGATGMIGDPGGRSTERQLLSAQSVLENVRGVERSLRKVLCRDPQGAQPLFLNNYDWINSFSLIDFLRDVGKHFRLSSMLAKDSVKSRLASEEGISFTEFSYQLLQGYDFLHLYKEHGVLLQMGGTDQWGNITAGSELVRKVEGVQVYGATFPLITRSDGKKFGKSEEGAIWLNEDLLSPYEFYQYLFRVADSDVIRLMQMLTYMDLEEIAAIEALMQSSQYHPNTAQRRLAEEVTRIVHGEEGLQLAQRVTLAAAPGEETLLTAEVLATLAKEHVSCKLTLESIVGKEIAELFVAAELAESKGEARRLIAGKGAYLNNRRLEDPHQRIAEADLVENRFMLLAVGKKKKRVIERLHS